MAAAETKAVAKAKAAEVKAAKEAKAAEAKEAETNAKAAEEKAAEEKAAEEKAKEAKAKGVKPKGMKAKAVVPPPPSDTDVDGSSRKRKSVGGAASSSSAPAPASSTASKAQSPKTQMGGGSAQIPEGRRGVGSGRSVGDPAGSGHVQRGWAATCLVPRLSHTPRSTQTLVFWWVVLCSPDLQSRACRITITTPLK